MVDVYDCKSIECRLMDEYATSLSLSADRRSLSVIWEDGASSDISAIAMRRACRCARCRRAFVDDVAQDVSPAPEITRIELVGSYAITVTFRDGHDRGIFPWSLLRSLDPKYSQEAAVQQD
jgi:DUF971 family protein